MKKLFTLVFLSVSLLAISQTPSLPSLEGFRCVTLVGDTVSLSQYHGKKLMIVNVASYCSYTPQYRPLQSLYDQYNQFNFEILGFPSDDFNAQGGTDSAIAATCSGYNVTFQIMEKVACISADTAPVYKWLQRQDLNGVQNSHVSWNFNKYLIDEAGHYVRHFDSPTSPTDTAITNWIMSPSVLPDTTTNTGIAAMGNDQLVQFTSANPTSSSIDLTINSATAQQVNITLFTIEGKQVATIYDGSTGTRQVSYPVATLPSGMYLIKVQTSNGQQIVRYMVQH